MLYNIPPPWSVYETHLISTIVDIVSDFPSLSGLKDFYNFYYCRLSIIQVAVAFQCKEEIISTIVDYGDSWENELVYKVHLISTIVDTDNLSGNDKRL